MTAVTDSFSFAAFAGWGLANQRERRERSERIISSLKTAILRNLGYSQPCFLRTAGFVVPLLDVRAFRRLKAELRTCGHGQLVGGHF